MSFQLPSRHHVGENTSRHASAAFLVEALLLLVFLIASLAVFMQMFSASLNRAEQARELTAAVAAASDTAERFAAYPAQAGGQEIVGDLLVVCDVSSEPRESGTFYVADIAVYPANEGSHANADSGDDVASGIDESAEPLYTISTARFESEVE